MNIQCEVMVVGKMWGGRGKGWGPVRTHRCLNIPRAGQKRCYIHLDDTSHRSTLNRALALVKANGYSVIHGRAPVLAPSARLVYEGVAPIRATVTGCPHDIEENRPWAKLQLWCVDPPPEKV